ncbi:hypothetical protein NHJ13051_006482 [Beauveria bassiana]
MGIQHFVCLVHEPLTSILADPIDAKGHSLMATAVVKCYPPSCMNRQFLTNAHLYQGSWDHRRMVAGLIVPSTWNNLVVRFQCLSSLVENGSEIVNSPVE